MRLRMCLIATDAVSFNVLFRGQLEFLKMAGVELTLVCGGSEDELFRLRRRGVGNVMDLGLVRQPTPFADLMGLIRLVWHLARHRYDIVLCTTPKALLLGSLASWLTAQRRRIAFFQGRVYENAQGIQRRIYATLDRISIAASTHVMFVSASLRELYQKERLLKQGEGHVIGAGSSNGVDTEVFQTTRFTSDECKSLRRQLLVPELSVMAIVIGRICRDKGMDELTQLARRLVSENLVFVVVGPIEASYMAESEGLFALPNVRHVPFTPDVSRYFAAADVHLVLSHREGFGNVAIEAAACGVPTIAFDVVGVRDSVVDGVSGIRVSRGDLGRFEQTLREVLSEPQAFRARFSSARDWVVRNYSSRPVWGAYLDYFQRISR